MPSAATVQVVRALETYGDSTISDGTVRLEYRTFKTLMDLLDAQLQAAGIQNEDCLSVECGSSAPDAILLVCLLRRGQSFVLSPFMHSPLTERDEAHETLKPTPRFCAFRVRMSREDSVTRAWSQEAHRAIGPEQPTAINPLQIEKCLHFERPSEIDLRAKVFLRTSGSMGVSKLVAHTHEHLILNAQACVEHYRYSAQDRMLIPLPIAHMYGFGAGLLPALLAGVSIDLLEGVNLIRYLDRERTFQPTVTLLTPTLCDILQAGFRQPHTQYRLVLTSGQRISEELFRAFDAKVGGCLVNQYGSSEMGAIAACHPETAASLKASTLGVPMPGVQLKVIPVTGNPVTGNSAFESIDPLVPLEGELLCCHPNGFAGYVEESGRWLSRHSPEQWHQTGDLVREQPDGSRQVLGRLGQSINRRGYLIQFAEIEQRLEQQASLRQVVVVRCAARQGMSSEGQLVAFVVPRTGSLVTSQGVHQLCRQLLPVYAVPDEIVLMPELPLLPNTKVDRQALSALAELQGGQHKTECILHSFSP
ncbi:MAG: class I adenylate-forming enzyme family protein [Myxococcota bacterium]